MEREERELVVRAIHELERTVTEAHGTGRPVDTERLKRDAVARLGIDEETYGRAIEADAGLALLERAALREAIGGIPDPGPYDRISREAPTGQPGDLSATARENVVSSQPAGIPEPTVRPGTTSDPDAAREIESPGDPGPTVLVPPRTADPLENPKLPKEVRRSGARGPSRT